MKIENKFKNYDACLINVFTSLCSEIEFNKKKYSETLNGNILEKYASIYGNID